MYVPDARNYCLYVSRSLVSGAGSLRVLSARHAGLHQVTAGSLRGARRLQVLLLSHNNLTLSVSAPTLPELGPSSSLGPLPELRVLDVSYNAVSEMFADWRLSMLQLQLLNLTHNQVGPLQVKTTSRYTFTFLLRVTFLCLFSSLHVCIVIQYVWWTVL